MSKKKQEAAVAAAVEVEASEKIARHDAAAPLIAEIMDIKRAISVRESEKATLKEKLDQVSDDIKGKKSKLDELEWAVIETMNGDATGRLPYGPTARVLKAVPVDEVGITREKLLEGYYPDLLTTLEEGKIEPSVSKAIAINGTTDRYITIPGPKGEEEPDTYRLVKLEPLSWEPGSSQTILKGVTGKVVEFMDAKFKLGAVDTMLLVHAPEKKAKSTAKKGNPGEATRGAGVTRAQEALVESIDSVFREIELDWNQIKDPTAMKLIYEKASLAIINHSVQTQINAKAPLLDGAGVQAMNLEELNELIEAIDVLALEDAVSLVQPLLPKGVTVSAGKEPVKDDEDDEPKKKPAKAAKGKGKLPPNPF